MLPFSCRSKSRYRARTACKRPLYRLTLGTPLGRVDAGAFIVTRSVYQPGQVLPLHSHAHASATVVLHGTVSEHVGGRRFECGPDRFLVRPAAAVHGNVYGPCGAECLIVGAHAEWVASDSVARDVFGAPRVASAPALLVVARRIRREMHIGDRAAELAVEGLALEVIAAAARQLSDRRSSSHRLDGFRSSANGCTTTSPAMFAST